MTWVVLFLASALQKNLENFQERRGGGGGVL